MTAGLLTLGVGGCSPDSVRAEDARGTLDSGTSERFDGSMEGQEREAGAADDGSWGDGWSGREAAPRDAWSSDVRAEDASSPERPFEAIPWVNVGAGVFLKETDAPSARNVFVGYAGYNITASSSQAWASALHERWLRAHGVRYVYAVQGPAAVDYRGKEIANRALMASLVSRVVAETAFVAVAAHSSGAYVAAEGFFRLFRERSDGGGLARGRVVYFNLDGDWGIATDPERNLSPEVVEAMRGVYFLSASDPTRGLQGFNTAAMRAGQAMYPARSELANDDARGANCATSACVHLSLINTRPASGGNDSYAQYVGGPVNVWYLDRAVSRLAP
jgi:hypothetical protein